MESLIQSEHYEEYGRFINEFTRIIYESAEVNHYQIYKFLGDGFILFFDEARTADDLIRVIKEDNIKIVKLVKKLIDDFIDVNVENIGLTYGISIGHVEKVSNDYFKLNEYYGRAINLASRLQSTNKNTNSILIQKDVYNKVKDKIIKSQMLETTRTLKNMFDDNKVRCYTFF